ncbi:MFS transporter [Granulicoccus sp. GXG6511]|uniref:MFS transporter n=1 Tax=Granulicoccus sp. GXG6511 TaxID=3381351 RepID=UPI003D7E2044
MTSPTGDLPESATGEESRPATSRARLWTLPFAMCALSVLGVGFTFFLLVPTMAGHAVAEFGASETMAGIASSSFFFGAVLARLPAGRAIGRLGSRRVSLGSLIGLVLSCLAYLLPATLATLLVIRVVHGVFFGFAATALVGAAIGLAPPSRRGEASGWSMMGQTLATGLAPFVALSLVNTGAGQRAVFLVTVGFAVLALGAALVAAPRLSGRPPADAPRSRTWVAPPALPIGIVVGLCAIGFSTLLAYLNMFAAERGLVPAASSYFLIYALVIAVSRPGAGVLQDRLNDDVVTLPLLVLVTVGMALTALAGGPAALLIGAAVLGLGYGTLLSVGQAIAVSRLSPTQMGLGVSSYFLVVDAATGLGPVLMGPLVGPLGFQNTFLAAGVLPLVGLLIYVLVARRVARPHLT